MASSDRTESKTSVLRPGTVVDRYRVVGTIGAGSMGDVVRGVDVDLNRPVAIKILSDRHRENDELRARFVREARAVAAISHPNVVQVFTTGTFDDRPYIAMELLDGVDLGSVVKQHGVMSSVQAARAGLDAARGLEAAAKAGLIHRDVKPSNLMLLSSGVVKVTDFGLAKPLDPSTEPALTAMGVVVGTPDYIAPEQARGEAIDERVDIYALGGTLYFLLAGDPPFRTGNPSEDKYLKVVARHLKQPPPDARSKNPAIDPALAALARRMMCKKSAERPDYPPLIAELADIVERLRLQGPSALPAVTGAGAAVATPEPTPFVGGPGNSPGGHRPNDRPHVPNTSAGSFSPALPAHRRSPSANPDVADDDDSAATLVRATDRASGVTGASADDEPGAIRWAEVSERTGPSRAGPRLSRWLIAVTALSVLVFFTGLGLMLFGPRNHPAAAGVPPDAAPLPDAAPDAGPPPTPPEGMILVRRADGSPWLFVATAPVTLGEYAKAAPDKRSPSRHRRLNAKPVTRVSYADAAAFAQAAGGHLCTPEEWAAAARTEGFTPADGLWEWVDDGSVGEQAARAVRAAPDKADSLRPGAHANVTFRLAKDI